MLSRAGFEQALPLLHKIGPLRFIMQFDKRGATNFGACGMDEAVARDLQRLGIIDVWLYKPVSSSTNRWGHRKVKRRYRKVSAGAHMPRLAALLREELRQGNIASIDGFDDGVNRVAFENDWKERRKDVQAAASRAWKRLTDELFKEEIANA